MDHSDIRGLATALHRSVAGLPRSDKRGSSHGRPRKIFEDSSHRVRASRCQSRVAVMKRERPPSVWAMNRMIQACGRPRRARSHTKPVRRTSSIPSIHGDIGHAQGCQYSGRKLPKDPLLLCHRGALEFTRRIHRDFHHHAQPSASQPLSHLAASDPNIGSLEHGRRRRRWNQLMTSAEDASCQRVLSAHRPPSQLIRVKKEGR